MGGKKSRHWTDQWMDDEQDLSGFRGRSLQKKISDSSSRSKGGTPLAASEANGTVVEVFPKLCRVRLDSDRSEVLCSYRRAQVYDHGLGGAGTRERSPVAVGDRVKARVTSPQSGVVEGVSQRTNQLLRPAPGRERDQNSEIQPVHVVAANVDVLVIVASCIKPDFSPGLVDRFLVAARLAGLKPLLCVTKMDLNPVESPWSLYQVLGVEVREMSVRSGLGVDALRAELEGRRVVFCGHSGVGKTSLLRALTEQEIGRVGEVNESTGKGRHTTTSAVLISTPGNSLWIDTPGMRSFGLALVEPEELCRYFPELEEAVCDPKPCSHGSKEESPGCAARGLPRYESFCRIRQSLLPEGDEDLAE
ncbi:MAG: ribosome small subunit-dependent GTPase A [Oligoflexia bacterium]